MKVEDCFHWGPYAILIRDMAFCSSEVGNHDYLDVPEIVEDICVCFSEWADSDLLQVFRQHTRSCIVKFVVYEAKPEHLGVALYYLYCKENGIQLSIAANTCRNLCGQTVSPKHICSVEYVHHHV
jgi:hypothetical protein